MSFPPSEPYVRFSRLTLSSQWFPPRDWLASAWASGKVNSPCIVDDPFHAVASGSPRLLADLILEGLQALGADVATT